VKDSAAQQAKPSLSDLAVWDEGPATSSPAPPVQCSYLPAIRSSRCSNRHGGQGTLQLVVTAEVAHQLAEQLDALGVNATIKPV
jgi:hypothetical protein